jgi:Fe-S-cluster containining protein
VLPLRIDPDQRFTCAGCARCCTRWDVLVSRGEADSYRAKDARRWFRERPGGPEGTDRDPFEPVAGTSGLFRIRRREDGECGFLSANLRCRLHEELGARLKPLTCRVFPYRFHPAPDAVVVTASFGCPTVVANCGERIATGSAAGTLRELRKEWAAGLARTRAGLAYAKGRSIDSASAALLRQNLIAILNRNDGDGARNLRLNVARMAGVLEDLTRHRVQRLNDADFAEYLKLTTGYAAKADAPVPLRRASPFGRLMQRGFLFLVAATRLRVEHSRASKASQRLMNLRLLAHFHGIGPACGGVDLAAIRRHTIDVNAPDLRPIAHNYLRASIESLGTGEHAILDELAIAVSFLNAACALALMKAMARERMVDRAIFSEALMEAVEATHIAASGSMGRNLERFAAGVEALRHFASPRR